MEGASWIARRTHVEVEKHINNIGLMMGEFDSKAKDCITDHRISEMNGREVIRSH
jgi:hypothetical protein